MIIRVTKKHIKNGKRYLSGSCPLALAFKDAGFDVVVGDIIGLKSNLIHMFTLHTEKSKAFMKNFDSGQRVKPTTFRFRRFA